MTPHHLCRKKGVSLLETIIYVSILAMIFVVVINTVIVVSNSFGKARVKRNITAQGGAALERILREARLADSVDIIGSTLGVHPGELHLNTIVGPNDETKTTRNFSLQGNDLMIREGTSEAVALTSGVEITNLVFYFLTASTTSEAIRIEMALSDSAGRFQTSQNFSGTAVLRRSY